MTVLNGALIAMVCLATIAVMLVWHIGGRGAWRRHNSGRAMMALLAIIAAITALAAASVLVGPLPKADLIYGILYALLLAAIFQIGAVILCTRRRPRSNRTTTTPEES